MGSHQGNPVQSVHTAPDAFAGVILDLTFPGIKLHPSAGETVQFGMKDAWKTAPVSLEICWVLGKWKNEGWDVDHIIDESLKWHISSFNAKSSPVPKEWETNVDRWLKRMGYRFVLRRFTYLEEVEQNSRLRFTSWWDNKGVAPCYKPFRLALRLSRPAGTEIFLTDADIDAWLPGDNLFDSSIFLPLGMDSGSYNLDLAIVDEKLEPKVKLAIEVRLEDGWYRLGEIRPTEIHWPRSRENVPEVETMDLFSATRGVSLLRPGAQQDFTSTRGIGGSLGQEWTLTDRKEKTTFFQARKGPSLLSAERRLK